MEMLDVFCVPSEYHVSGHGWGGCGMQNNQPLFFYRKGHDNLCLFTKWQFISKLQFD